MNINKLHIKKALRELIVIVFEILILMVSVSMVSNAETVTMTRTEMLNKYYPVGCYFETTDTSFNPNTALVGTWVEDDAGNVHVAAGTADGVTYTVGDTGGNKDAIVVSHSHTVNSHAHTIPKLSGTAASNGAHTHTPATPSNSDAGFCAQRGIRGRSGTYGLAAGRGLYAFASTYGYADVACARNTSSAGAHTHSVTTNASTTGAASPDTSTEGSSGTNANMQPYSVVKRWHRTA